MAVDPRQIVAGVLTVTMFVMLGNMIARDHFYSVIPPLFITILILSSSLFDVMLLLIPVDLYISIGDLSNCVIHTCCCCLFLALLSYLFYCCFWILLRR